MNGDIEDVDQYCPLCGAPSTAALEDATLKDAAKIIKAYTGKESLTPDEFDDLHEAWSITEYYHNRPDPDADGNPNAKGEDE